MEEKLLTIVVPAYNMEKFIRRCLNSIVSQQVMNCVEVYVVNDGSKDSTLDIIREYEQDYPGYIHVIDKDNGNYGSVMNVALSKASGRYFRTLDADDWYETPAFERFVQELHKTDADMLICERYEFFEKTGIKELVKLDEQFPRDQDVPVSSKFWNSELVRRLTHVSSVCYKTDILRESGLRWSERVFYTDNEYLFWPLRLVKTLRFVSDPIYVYYKGRDDQSVSSSNIRKNFHSFDVVTNKLLQEYIKRKDENVETEPLMQKILSVDLLPNFYLSLIVDGLKNKKSIDNVERLLKHNNLLRLLSETAKIKYVEAYRNNIFKYFLMRINYYRLRLQNKLLAFIFFIGIINTYLHVIQFFV